VTFIVVVPVTTPSRLSFFHRPDAQSGERHVEDRMMVSTLLEGISDRQRQALLLRYITQLTIPRLPL